MKLLIKIKRWILNKTVCKVKGHELLYFEHNGFIKYSLWTNRPIPLFQAKCRRCNRYYGKKFKEDKLLLEGMEKQC